MLHAHQQTTIAAPPALAVWFTLDGVERCSRIPPGRDRWDVVAAAVGERFRAEGRAEDPPAYDAGTRSWTLMVTLIGPRRRRAEQVAVPVRWS